MDVQSAALVRREVNRRAKDAARCERRRRLNFYADLEEQVARRDVVEHEPARGTSALQADAGVALGAQLDVADLERLAFGIEDATDPFGAAIEHEIAGRVVRLEPEDAL